MSIDAKAIQDKLEEAIRNHSTFKSEDKDKFLEIITTVLKGIVNESGVLCDLNELYATNRRKYDIIIGWSFKMLCESYSKVLNELYVYSHGLKNKNVNTDIGFFK